MTHRVTQTLGDLPYRVCLVESVDEHHELVATQPCDRIAATHPSNQPASRFSQHVVAGRIAERVVDVLHRIDIGNDHRDDAPIPNRMPERDTQAIIEDRPSRQVGDLVVHQIRRQRRLEWRRDFAAKGHETLHLTPWTDTRYDRHRHRHRFARRGEHCKVAVPGAETQQRRPDFVVIAHEHLRRKQVCSREPGAVADTEPLPRRLVEVQHPTPLVHDAHQVRRTFDKPEQLADHVRVEFVRHRTNRQSATYGR
jgi:hypothetical protein